MLQPVFGHRPAQSVPLFSGTALIPRPTTIGDSFERESNVRLNGNSVLGDLIARMDEAMTVTGEKYSGNEAFTTQFHMKLTPEGQRAVKKGETFFSQIDREVDWTKKFFMVMSGVVADSLKGTPLAYTRSTFCSIDPDSVKTGTNRVKALPTELSVPDHDVDANDANDTAARWNTSYMEALKPIERRLLGDKTTAGEALVDVKDLPESDLRATDANFYVPTDMINKKQTGHGGVSVAKAIEGMLVLAAKNFGKQSLDNVNLVEFTASYKAPFVMDHALQADTTVDHVDKDGNVYLSTRLYKCDTKGRREQDRAELPEAEREQDGYILTGPVTIINAKVKAPKGFLHSTQKRFEALKESIPLKDADTRQQEAIGWSQIQF